MKYAVTLQNGNVQIRDINTGAVIRTIGGPFTHAVVMGEDVHLTQPNGKVKIVKISTGSVLRVV